MNNELIKQLQDNGFPFGEYVASIHGSGRFCIELETTNDYLVIPTLEELIKACGDELYDLRNIKSPDLNDDEKKWRASDGSYIDSYGDTPLEAVAHFWLALNKK
jgi:hypothetical protein